MTATIVHFRKLSAFLLGFASVVAAPAFAAAQGTATTLPPGAPSTPSFPKFEDVEKRVHEELQKRPGYQRGDLLTRGEVAPVFTEIKRLGWTVADQSTIESRLLPDSDPLVKDLRAPNARGFMRRVSPVPGGFDRLDRLRRMPYGQQRVQELVRGPDGHLMIQYMATTPNGRNLGQSLERGVNGQNLNQRTGRLYTEQQLIEKLKASHAQEAARLTPPPRAKVTTYPVKATP